MKNLISILDVSVPSLERLMADAARLKTERAEGCGLPLLAGRCLAMIFEKPSTRTRVSFEVGMFELGGHALFLDQESLQLRRGETIADTARVLSRYVSAVMIRARRHETITEFAAHADMPVINGLSDREHPCQILADIFTIRERFGRTDGLVAAWVGDGNNVCNSLVLSSGLTGMEVRVASPARYAPDPAVLDRARAAGGRVTLAATPEDAVTGADVVFTDAWVSMGDEGEEAERRKAFAGYRLDDPLVDLAKSGAIVMHCLPAHRGDEITDSVLDGSRSAVWDEAENRLHVQKAVLAQLICPYDERSFQQMLLG
ncbi:MAG: ornithine carbamoyltransferase [Methanospirillum sp.]|nr:ornithine carbamoyltransferase [Methanospirillum sp.]